MSWAGGRVARPSRPHHHPPHRSTARHARHAPLPARQVFVANPNKTRPVVEILHNNRDKLLKYLDDFHADRGQCAATAIAVLAGWLAGWCMGAGWPARQAALKESSVASAGRPRLRLRARRTFANPHPAPGPSAAPGLPPADDEQFKEEKAVIIKEISLLQPPPPLPPA